MFLQATKLYWVGPATVAYPRDNVTEWRLGCTFIAFSLLADEKIINIKANTNSVTAKHSVREEANAIVAYAFRNGFLEDLHAGEYSELLENKKLSRITDAEMKRLMIESCERVAKLLEMKEKHPREYWRHIDWLNASYTKNWNK